MSQVFKYTVSLYKVNTFLFKKILFKSESIQYKLFKDLFGFRQRKQAFC